MAGNFNLYAKRSEIILISLKHPFFCLATSGVPSNPSEDLTLSHKPLGTQQSHSEIDQSLGLGVGHEAHYCRISL
jgi:hypothetical protein